MKRKKTKKKIKDLIQEFLYFREKTIQLNEEIGKILCKALKDIIPDIKNDTGHELGIGADVIALDSFSRNVGSRDKSKHLVDLEEIIEKFISGSIIITRFGIYLTKEEAEIVKTNG